MSFTDKSNVDTFLFWEATQWGDGWMRQKGEYNSRSKLWLPTKSNNCLLLLQYLNYKPCFYFCKKYIISVHLWLSPVFSLINGKNVNIRFSIRPFTWFICTSSSTFYIWTKFPILCGSNVGWRNIIKRVCEFNKEIC